MSSVGRGEASKIQWLGAPGLSCPAWRASSVYMSKDATENWWRKASRNSSARSVARRARRIRSCCAPAPGVRRPSAQSRDAGAPRDDARALAPFVERARARRRIDSDRRRDDLAVREQLARVRDARERTADEHVASIIASCTSAIRRASRKTTRAVAAARRVLPVVLLSLHLHADLESNSHAARHRRISGRRARAFGASRRIARKSGCRSRCRRERLSRCGSLKLRVRSADSPSMSMLPSITASGLGLLRARRSTSLRSAGRSRGTPGRPPPTMPAPRRMCQRDRRRRRRRRHLRPDRVCNRRGRSSRSDATPTRPCSTSSPEDAGVQWIGRLTPAADAIPTGRSGAALVDGMPWTLRAHPAPRLRWVVVRLHPLRPAASPRHSSTPSRS